MSDIDEVIKGAYLVYTLHNGRHIDHFRSD